MKIRANPFHQMCIRVLLPCLILVTFAYGIILFLFSTGTTKRGSRRVEPGCRDSLLQYTIPRMESNHYSHSMVEGGFWLMSYTTRLTPFTSLMIREEMEPSSS